VLKKVPQRFRERNVRARETGAIGVKLTLLTRFFVLLNSHGINVRRGVILFLRQEGKSVPAANLAIDKEE